MKIASLNVNGFLGCNGKLNKTESMERIKEYIHSYLEDVEALVIFQEVPHKDKTNGIWIDNPLKSFEHVFADYKILKPQHLIDSYQCTIAICNKNSAWKNKDVEILVYDEKYSFGNKFVELELGDLTLLGVHMPVDENMWMQLITALDRHKFSIIIGDFNAHENPHRKEHISIHPKEIREKGYIDLVPGNIVTYYPVMTTIDHLYIDVDRQLINDNERLIITPVNFSDHVFMSLESPNESNSFGGMRI